MNFSDTKLCCRLSWGNGKCFTELSETNWNCRHAGFLFRVVREYDISFIDLIEMN